MSASTSPTRDPRLPDETMPWEREDHDPEPEPWEENPFVEHHPLHDFYDRRVSGNQDQTYVVTDWYSRRGTGKTVASLQLAAGLDRTEEGLTKEKVCITPQEFMNAIHEQPKGSALVVDETEIGASNRQAMSTVNQAFREKVSTGRVFEKYYVFNAPSLNFIDKHLIEMADIWVLMRGKGYAQCHALLPNPYSDELTTPKYGIMTFRDIARGTQLREVYNHLTEEKKKYIRGDRGDKNFISMSEHNEEVSKAVEETERSLRDEHAASFYLHDEVREAGVPQRVIAEALGVSQQTIASAVQDHRGDA